MVVYECTWMWSCNDEVDVFFFQFSFFSGAPRQRLALLHRAAVRLERGLGAWPAGAFPGAPLSVCACVCELL